MVDLVPDQKKVNFHHWVGLLVHRGMHTSQPRQPLYSCVLPASRHETSVDSVWTLYVGEDKDAGGEIVEIKDQVSQIWLLDGHRSVLFQKPDVLFLPKGDLSKAAAHW